MFKYVDQLKLKEVVNKVDLKLFNDSSFLPTTSELRLIVKTPSTFSLNYF